MVKKLYFPPHMIVKSLEIQFVFIVLSPVAYSNTDVIQL